MLCVEDQTEVLLDMFWGFYAVGRILVFISVQVTEFSECLEFSDLLAG